MLPGYGGVTKIEQARDTFSSVLLNDRISLWVQDRWNVRMGVNEEGTLSFAMVRKNFGLKKFKLVLTLG